MITFYGGSEYIISWKTLLIFFKIYSEQSWSFLSEYNDWELVFMHLMEEYLGCSVSSWPTVPNNVFYNFLSSSSNERRNHD
jgi:hypothetical protein